jgi:hypothetical protein
MLAPPTDRIAMDWKPFSAAVIDERPRQVEHSRHPGDHRDDVKPFTQA